MWPHHIFLYDFCRIVTTQMLRYLRGSLSKNQPWIKGALVERDLQRYGILYCLAALQSSVDM